MTVGEKLKLWRTEHGLEQKEMSAFLGIPVSTYKKYERDVSLPGFEAMEAFVRAGLNANWLLTGEGPMLLKDLQGQVAEAQAAELNMRYLIEAIENVEKILNAARKPIEPAVKATIVALLYRTKEKPIENLPPEEVTKIIQAFLAETYR